MPLVNPLLEVATNRLPPIYGVVLRAKFNWIEVVEYDFLPKDVFL